MVIPRLLSRGTSPAAQRDHFAAILSAAPELPAVIYNSPYYGFETKADLFFDLRNEFSNLVGFKEFGGADALSYAAEHITSTDDTLVLMAGVDTQVFHGFVNCGARGAITGIGNCLPAEVLHYLKLCGQAAEGCTTARRYAEEPSRHCTSCPSLTKARTVPLQHRYRATPTTSTISIPPTASGKPTRHAEDQLKLFKNWWTNWDGKP